MQFITLTELADLLRVHRTTLYRMCSKKHIPGAFKVGRDWRFHVDALLDWFKQGCP